MVCNLGGQNKNQTLFWVRTFHVNLIGLDISNSSTAAHTISFGRTNTEKKLNFLSSAVDW